MADGRKNNGGYRPNSGRKGYGIEQQKKRVLDQAFHTLKMSMLKEGKELTEKEKIAVAEKIVLKEIGKNIDITSKGEKLPAPIINLKDYVQGNDSNETNTETE